ncbi:hypothetical protein Q8F55_004565 [Vanrija albida]|uniref:F-box domain-containing protein n=1 Tax=Vanrija albida TaxID=181172 RepID=A0ABR3Q7Q8_9TREE
MPAALGFDHASYPHLMLQVLDYAEPDALLALRAASKEMQDMADARLFGHVVLGVHDAYAWPQNSASPVPIRSAIRNSETYSEFGTWAGGWCWGGFGGGWGGGLPGPPTKSREWWQQRGWIKPGAIPGDLVTLGKRIAKYTHTLDIHDAPENLLSFLGSIDLRVRVLRVHAAYNMQKDGQVPAVDTLVLFPPPPTHSLALTLAKSRPYVYPLVLPYLEARADRIVHHIHFPPESLDLVHFEQRYRAHNEATTAEVFVFAPPLDCPRSSLPASEAARPSRFASSRDADPSAAEYVLGVRTRQWARMWRDVVAYRVHAGRTVTLVDYANAAPSVWSEPAGDGDKGGAFAAQLVEDVGAALAHYRATGWSWGFMSPRPSAIPPDAGPDARAREDMARLLRFVTAEEFAREEDAEALGVPLRLVQHPPRDVRAPEPGERGYAEWAFRQAVEKKCPLPSPWSGHEAGAAAAP